MKLLESIKNKITKYKYGENITHLQNTEVVLFHCNIVNSDSQQDSRVLYPFVPNKPFGSLLEIAPTNFMNLKTSNSEFSFIEAWFTDKNSQLLDIEGRINLILVIK